MIVRMAGIDFNKASIENREKFALTSSSQVELLRTTVKHDGVLGGVVINTCNRMELWLSYQSGEATVPFELLCGYFGVSADQYREYFSEREGDDAVRHLFEMACGLKSMIFGEEQILTQVKEAIHFARDCGAADPVLEAMFRYAVTAAKKAKTQVRLTAVDRSVAETAVRFLKVSFGDLKDTNCLVIGSGEMGRLAARALVTEGCHVTMTLRQYKSGDAVVPVGCKVIDYEERYKKLADAKIIISATRSPHHTLVYGQIRAMNDSSEKILFDLALPRDIDPKIAELPNIRLYDIDHLGGRLQSEADNKEIARVKELIDEAMAEFERWCCVRKLMPKISEIGALATADAEERLRHSLKNAPLDEACRQLIHEAAGKAVGKVVENILLSLQKDSGMALIADVLSGIEEDAVEKVAEQEKLPPRFPLFVDLSGRTIAVVGAGPIALRRVKALSAYPCSIRVIAPEAHPEIEALHNKNKIVYQRKAFEPADLDGAYLVIAATDDRALNQTIAADAEKNSQHCSIADCKEECTFYFPATVHYEGGVIGICGTGDNHGKTKKIAADIREYIETRELL